MLVEYRTIRQGRYSCTRRRFAATDEVCGGLLAGPRRTRHPAASASALAGSDRAQLSAIEHASEQRRQHGTQLRQNLERATYEAKRAERQYQAVEPENRLVARTLEANWKRPSSTRARPRMLAIGWSTRS
ncbi:hypothetical protein V5E97_08370 [Singulisphaera sp. Ch08]|uniref:Transposase n=1 Tax=Singulisphaera sp. Ch08 TaxID=3120278 RepID=A0AAU7CLW6_9BACT